MGDQGARLRHMASAGSQSQQVARAIDWLKSHFTQPLRIEDLATQVNMSTSTFHHHFRALTAMSPLQYQKWLRLNEARRLMLTERLDATTAAYQGGYESPPNLAESTTAHSARHRYGILQTCERMRDDFVRKGITPPAVGRVYQLT